ncbi:hypothetical protein NW762_007704 [Fusarium torreyae]|uniref:Uncharacterized protein n=1 Tax=Fusarium torreyae TaxID=1237075 RepID=A0A9W8VD15_9HYPO|nr:hypothetical protein NW762_007704 [Fusarium torreyae]
MDSRHQGQEARTLWAVCFTAKDWQNRKFKERCQEALKPDEHGKFPSPYEKGPTATQLAGALLGMTNLDEDRLCPEWHTLASWYPDYAMILRRSVSDMQAPKNANFQVRLKDTQLVMSSKLTITNFN